MITLQEKRGLLDLSGESQFANIRNTSVGCLFCPRPANWPHDASPVRFLIHGSNLVENSQLQTIFSLMKQLRPLKSKAFRKGFVEGFGAPCLLFSSTIFTRAEFRRATIDSAWNSVEKALSASFLKEIQRGEAAGETSKRRREAA